MHTSGVPTNKEANPLANARLEKVHSNTSPDGGVRLSNSE